jgi:hypothetical protein
VHIYVTSNQIFIIFIKKIMFSLESDECLIWKNTRLFFHKVVYLDTRFSVKHYEKVPKEK